MRKANFKISGLVYSNEVCPIHHVKLVSFSKTKPFCRLCAQKKIEHEKQEKIKRFIIEDNHDFLYKQSLVARTDVLKETFDTFESRKGEQRHRFKAVAERTALEYLNNPNKTFNTIFLGKAGTGKTHLAMAVLNYVNDHSMQRCLFLSIAPLLGQNKSYYADHTSTIWSPEYTVEQVRKADLVVIDDLGAETANGNATNFVQSVIFNIYEASQRIITTTNFSKQRIKQTYDERLLSRIAENSQKHIYDFSSLKDLRVIGF